MRLDQLTEVFLKQIGARKDGAAYLVPPDADASLFVALEGETLTIARIVRLEAVETSLVVDTSRGERFIVAAEDVRAVKMDRVEAQRRERAAGFNK